MIQICPAILTDNLKEFDREFKLYSKSFDQVDIDFNTPDDDFYGKVLVSPNIVFDYLKKHLSSSSPKIGLHLMVDDPLDTISLWNKVVCSTNCIFYIHQESNIYKVTKSEHFNKYEFGIAIKAESNPMQIEFYNQFSEIQLMTIETGQQGNPFKKNILSRAEWLKSEGFDGRISIDGGVNLRTAEFIRNYKIDRVSVGSYFSKSTNLNDDIAKLTLALNM